MILKDWRITMIEEKLKSSNQPNNQEIKKTGKIKIPTMLNDKNGGGDEK
jgi:hypothetical protein